MSREAMNRMGSGSQRRVWCPTQGSDGQVGLVVQDEVAHGAAGDVGGDHAVTAERADESQPGLAVERCSRAPVAGYGQRAAPVVGDPGLRRGGERFSQGLAQPLVDAGVLLVLG